MFDREQYIKMLRSVMKDHWSEAQYEQRADFIEEKYSHLKEGDNVIHIHHISQLITKEDLEEIKEILTSVNYELSSWDDSGIPKASIQTQVYLYLNHPIVQGIISGLLTNIIWPCIVKVSHKVWNKINKKPYIQIHAGSIVTENKASFSIKVNLKNSELEFLTDNLDSGNFNEAIEKIKDCLKDHVPVNQHQKSEIAIYDAGRKRWNIVEISPEFLKKTSSKVLRTLNLEDYIKESHPKNPR